MKKLRPVLGVVAALVIAFSAFHILHVRQFQGKLEDVHELYLTESREKVRQARAGYERLREEAVFGKERRAAETGVLACDATDAWYEVQGRFDVPKYEKALDLMLKARDATDDPGGNWQTRIDDLKKRHDALLAPELSELRAGFAAAKAAPLEKGLRECEVLYRNRQRWADLGFFIGDAEREALFKEIGAHLARGYPEVFEQVMAKARAQEGAWQNNDKAWLAAKAEPLRWLPPVERYNKAKAEAFRATYADDLKLAERARRRLDAILEAEAEALGGG